MVSFMAPWITVPGSADSHLYVERSALQDLTGMLKLVRIMATGSSSVVYRCLYAQSMEVAVKAITFPHGFDPTEKDEFMQRVNRELQSWRRLEHPNIVQFLGIAYDKDFGSDYPCIVSVWMQNGTLFDYVKQRGIKLSVTDRVQLIKGSVVGLEYLHSQGVIHGDFHPGNILIDERHNPRLTDFGLSLSVSPMEDQLSYLWTDPIRSSRAMWAPPETLYPELYPNLKREAALLNDIYSLGCVILFIFSGKYPWKNRGEAENRLKGFQNPQRPAWPVNIPDDIWNFLERCWSPWDPQNRPSAQEVLKFCADSLEKSLRPNPASEINVVLFGALGSGKSSIVNLLAGKPITQISADADPCTERPTSYQISIHGRKIRLWDTMGFFLPHDAPASHLLPYERAQTFLRNLSDGVGLILLCTDKGTISPSLGHLYQLINFFFDGRAPIAFVVTHFDLSDEEWWERNKRDIVNRTSIPVESIPHACVSTVGTDCGQSKRALEELLQTYATAVAPISLRRDLSSHTKDCSDLITRCRVNKCEASVLVEKFRIPPRPFNVVFFGKTGAGKSSIVNLIAGHRVVETSSDEKPYAHPHWVNTGLQRFRIWDLLDDDEGKDAREVDARALESTAQSIRESGGVDLLVFCTKFDGISSEEPKRFKLIEETICRGRPPVAVVVTDFDMQNSVKEWWETNGKTLVMSLIGRGVVGYSCIPPLVNYDPCGAEHDETLVKSRLSIETMLEDSVSHRITRFQWTKVPVVLANFLAKVIGIQ